MGLHCDGDPGGQTGKEERYKANDTLKRNKAVCEFEQTRKTAFSTMFENEQIKNRRWGQVSMESFKRIDEAILGISVFIGNLWEDANSMLNMK